MFLANASPLFLLRFPREVVHDVVRQHGTGNLSLEMTVRNTDDATVPLFLAPGVASGGESVEAKRYVLLNARDIWIETTTNVWNPPPPGRTVFAVTHPRQLPAVHYHGYTPAQRDFLRRSDVSIQLIDIGASTAGGPAQ